MDQHLYHYPNIPPTPDLSPGPSHNMAFRPYGPPVPPPTPDSHRPHPQSMHFGGYCPPPPPQNLPPRPAPQQTHGSRDINHQHPGRGQGSWPTFPQDGCSNPFPSLRPPPGYFPSHPPGQPGVRGAEGGWVPSQIPRDALDHRSALDGHCGERFDLFGAGPYQSGFQSNRNVLGHRFSTFAHGPVPSGTSPTQIKSNTADPDALQRQRDEQWIHSFLHKRKIKASAEMFLSADHQQSLSEYKEKIYTTLQMLAELSALCQSLRSNLEDEGSYTRASELRESLELRLEDLTHPGTLEAMRRKRNRIQTKRAWMRRKKIKREEETREREARAAEKEAAIDKHQMKRIQELEEKNKERELKLAADAVLSEVRRKQADTKRMVDILKALEKLRRLRKDAASRKGLFPERRSDEVLEGHLLRLRTLIRKRTAVYGAEEKALRVMLEGEQEEERKRERDRRQKRERDRHQQKKRELNSMLFGAELPPDHPLQVYQQFYTQAECSLPVLVQIRRDWDQFLVPVDHPDGSSVPQGWVLPDPPADEVWATALEK